MASAVQCPQWRPGGCVLQRKTRLIDFTGRGSCLRRIQKVRLIYVTCLSLALLLSATATAADWPQILGPNRNGHAENERLADTWPAAGPQTLWRYPLGSGYAGAAVVGDRVVVFHRISNNERVECLSAA